MIKRNKGSGNLKTRMDFNEHDDRYMTFGFSRLLFLRQSEHFRIYRERVNYFRFFSWIFLTIGGKVNRF